MKAVILAGGKGTRISEETYLKPKPMVNIGGKPILWHILKIYSSYNINHFIICCGYKGYLIKEYFSNYFLHMSDVTIDLSNNSINVHHKKSEPWKITLVDTGDNTNTGGRLRRVRSYLDDENFAFTYGDGLSDVNIELAIENHLKSNKLATLTAVRPPGRYGALEIDEDSNVSSFIEKKLENNQRIDLVRIRLEKNMNIYPDISVNRQNINAVFKTSYGDSRLSKPVSEDVRFELSLSILI